MYSDDNDDLVLPLIPIPKPNDNNYFMHILSGHKSGDTGGKPSGSGYGLKWYGFNVAKGSFVCPGEKRPFANKGASTAKEEETAYWGSHYGVNAFLHAGSSGGSASVSISSAMYKKRSAMHAPSRVISMGDNQRTETLHFNAMYFISYRHTSGDPRINLDSAGAARVPPIANTGNILYGDGHVDSHTWDYLYRVSLDPKHDIINNSGSATNSAQVRSVGAGFYSTHGVNRYSLLNP